MTESTSTARPARPATSRRQQLLDLAAEMFARRGFHGVSVTDLGAAAGISGPALYKHFPSKDAMLAEMLVSISEELLSVGRARAASAAETGDVRSALAALVGWHVDFALAHKALIIVQDRDWSSLPDEAREKVRGLQRDYVDLWSTTLQGLHPELTLDRARATVHATFGLINSTPRSARVPDEEMRDLLAEMAMRALDA
ncbi:TetR/AcrR family transcriptional regulator [Nocardioides daphniae]|uniref:TetR family transcriptional regulator n=2 Tax=Nocardioides daphniae TaxID=402297 RepID=A0ABQ1Q2T5_9ACTN|nr:TetR/AcrR family transcriptional regulator [Nocardioides daphniae]GGD09930.1 TetR family transcriptional regulator [Nocardioides daphniae]